MTLDEMHSYLVTHRLLPEKFAWSLISRKLFYGSALIPDPLAETILIALLHEHLRSLDWMITETRYNCSYHHDELGLHESLGSALEASQW